MQKLSFIDTILTFLLPFLIVLIVNVAILVKIRNFKKTPKQSTVLVYSKSCNFEFNHFPITLFNTTKSNERISASSQMKSTSLLQISTNNTLIAKNPAQNNARSSSYRLSANQLVMVRSSNFEIIRRRKIYRKMATILMMISICFLILNFLTFVSKMIYFLRGLHYQMRSNDLGSSANTTLSNSSMTINSEVDPNNSVVVSLRSHLDASDMDELLERVACYFYYMNFSINFIIYTMFSSKFKLRQGHFADYFQCSCFGKKLDYNSIKRFS